MTLLGCSLVLLVLTTLLLRLESSSTYKSDKRWLPAHEHQPHRQKLRSRGSQIDLPRVYLWEWRDGSSRTSRGNTSQDKGIWGTMFDHQKHIKELLRKCSGVTHHLTGRMSEADTILCAEKTHGRPKSANREMLKHYTDSVSKHLIKGPGRSAGIVIGSKNMKREFGTKTATIAKKGLLILGTEAMNSNYMDFSTGPLAAMFIPIPYAASPMSSSSYTNGRTHSRKYMFSFIGTNNVSVWADQRHRVMSVLQRRNDSLVHIPETRIAVKANEFDIYLDSNFCPAPGGDSRSSKRFFDGIMHGCMPVVCDRAFPLPFHSQTPISKVVQYLDCSSEDEISRGLDALQARAAKLRLRAEDAMEAVKRSYNYSTCGLMGHLMREVKIRESLPLLFSSYAP